MAGMQMAASTSSGSPTVPPALGAAVLTKIVAE